MTTQAIAQDSQTLERRGGGLTTLVPAGLADVLTVPGFVQLILSNALGHSFAMRMQGIAIAWVVLGMTGSKMWLGVINGVPAVSVVLFSLLGGVLADSRDARKVLVAVRSTLTAAAFLVFVLVTTGSIRIEHLMIYALLVVGLSAIDMPVGRTMTLRTVGPSRLLSANATQNFAMNVINIATPTSMAVLIGVAGPEAAFAVLGVGYGLGALLILRSRIGGEPSEPRRAQPLADLRAGLSYVRSVPAVSALVLLGFLMPFAGVYFAMVPVFAREVLDAGPAGLGLLVGTFSGGALIGSVVMMVNGQIGGRGCKVAVLSVIFGAGMIAFAVSDSLLLSSVISVGMGTTGAFWQNMLTTMVQTESAPEMRGRALSIFTMGFQLASLGWLIGGVSASVFGPQVAVVIAGIAFAGIGGLIFATHREVCMID
jgi:MFS family permease